jgi:hypothetical protein
MEMHKLEIDNEDNELSSIKINVKDYTLKENIAYLSKSYFFERMDSLDSLYNMKNLDTDKNIYSLGKYSKLRILHSESNELLHKYKEEVFE